MKDQTIPNVIFCSVLVLIESLQVLIVLVLLLRFVPIHAAPLVQHLFPRHLALVFPKRDMFFYHFFVGLVILGQALLLGALRKQLNAVRLRERLWPYFWVEAGWLFLMVFAVFEFFVYGYADWAMHLLYAVIGLAVLSKLFWKELEAGTVKVFQYLSHYPGKTRLAADIIFPILLAILIFVPDLKAVVARMWIGDCLVHMEGSLIAHAWAYAKGAKLNVDIYTHYGLGMPIFITLITKLFGGLSYERVVGVLVGGTIIYFILCYFFLRCWLKNVALAMAGVLLAIKWQMFHQGNYPFLFNYPYSTVCRYWFDIACLWLILAHIRRGEFKYLLAAGAVCGLSLFHVTDTGIYLLLDYLFYLGWLAVEGLVLERQSLQQVAMRTAGGVAAVFISAFAWFAVFQGRYVFSPVFWGNMFERADLFFVGHGNLPMYKSLVEGDYSSSLMGFVMALTYCGSLITVASLCVLKKISRQHIMVAVLCVYGLGLYHYYILRSANTAYYSVCIPFVFVLCWLAQMAMEHVWPQRRRTISGVLLAGAAFALLTTHAYLNYPDMLNFSANPVIAPVVKWPNKGLPYYFNNIPRSYPEAFKLPANDLGQTDEQLPVESDFKTDAQLKEYFDREFDYKEDAGLIDRLTSPDDSVALISSFATRILMQADRRPFFYYFPMVDSRPMHMRMFPFSVLWTTDRLTETLKELEKYKPPYVFLEKIMLTRQVPRLYMDLYPEELYMLNYLYQHYKPYQYGKYLVALKRT